MKIHPNAYRFCFAITLGLLIWQVSGCGDSGQGPFEPDIVSIDTCESGRYVQPQFITRVNPVYPELAKRAGLEGTVWVSVLIDTTGAVVDVKVVKDSGTNAGFEQASIDAAWQQIFSPAMRCGEPVEVWATFSFRFKLRGGLNP